MKKIIILLFALLGLQFVNGQGALIPKTGDNEIIIDSASFRQVAEALLDAGYIIDKYDSSLGFISTQVKPISKHNASVKIRAHFKNGKAYLMGVYRVGSSQFAFPNYADHSEYYPISYFKSALSTSRACWNEIKNIALSINSNIEFAKI